MEILFIDVAHIKVIAGKGGDGAVAWRREKYEPAGGPAGGDGGNGGSVILQTDTGLHTLMDFRYQKEYRAKNGENGRNKKQFGKDGEDIILKVPVGTLIKDEKTGHVIADLNEAGKTYIIAQGGRGGRGNAKFTTSTRQAPSFAQAGSMGEEREICLELKVLADVGLIGFPNVGKSTLLSVVSAARPKVANYHFTTLQPNLGVVSMGQGQSFVVADIPGLIEGASQGVGLGHDFLRHIERTRILVHVLDMSGQEGRDPLDDYVKINEELVDYHEKLAQKPQLVFANKMDLPGSQENLDRFKAKYPDLKVFAGSAATTKDLTQLLYGIQEALKDLPYESLTFDQEYVEEEKERAPGIEVKKENGRFLVQGPYIDKLLRSTYFDDRESLRYFQENLRKNGVVDKLRDLGIQEGESVFINDYEFEFFE